MILARRKIEAVPSANFFWNLNRGATIRFVGRGWGNRIPAAIRSVVACRLQLQLFLCRIGGSFKGFL